MQRNPKWIAGDEAQCWSLAQKFYESLKYALANGTFEKVLKEKFGNAIDLKAKAEELLQTLSNPEAAAQFVGMMAASIAIKKGIKCGSKMAGAAGAVLAAGEAAAFAIRLGVLMVEVNSVTFKNELKDVAPKVAEFTIDVLKDATFMAWTRGWKCFPAGTQVVVGVEPDSTLPGGQRYVTQAIETLQVGGVVLAR